MNREPEILAGLDIGTTKIAVIVAERENPSQIARIVGVGSAPAKGIRKGVIVNFDEAVRSIRKAVKETRDMVGASIDSATVSFSGMDIQSLVSNGMVALGKVSRPVATGDIDGVIEAAQSSLIVPATMFPLHTIPTKYTIDGNSGIDDPLGMTGLRLEMELQTVTVPKTIIQDIVNCVHAAGININGILVKPLASALGSLTQDEMERGVISICMGGGTTSVAFYSLGRPIRMSVIPIGGDHITNDLSFVLRLPIHVADKLKEKLFSDNENDLLELENENLGHSGTINMDAAVEVIKCRLEDLFTGHVAPLIDSFGTAMFPGGIVLSGGVSKTPYIDELVSDIIKLPVRIGVPLDYRNMPKECHDSSYVNLDGVLRYILTKEKNPYRFIETPLSQLGPRWNWTRDTKIKKKPEKQKVITLGVIVGKIKETFKDLFM